METKRVLRHFIETTFLRGDGAELADTASLIKSGLLDSTDQLELVLFVEGEFDITVGEDEAVADNLDTVERIVAFVDRKRSETSVTRDPGPSDRVPAARE